MATQYNIEIIGTTQTPIQVAAFGRDGDVGPQGPAGQSFEVDQIDTFANRSLYDNEAEGFAFLASDTSELFIRETATPGVWSLGVPFQGPKGDTGEKGDPVTTSSLASPPVSPVEGDLWFNVDDGNLYIYYNDGTSIQWVSTTYVAGDSNPNTISSTTDVPEGTNLYYTDARVTSLVDKAFVDALGVDADTWDGQQFATYLNQPVLTSSDVLFRSNRLDVTQAGNPTNIGQFLWNSGEQTADLRLNNDVTLQVGQENLLLARNNTGSTIPNGTPVYYTGSIGGSGIITIAPMIADGSIPVSSYLGITTQAILNGTDGFVGNWGKVRSINTSTYTAGDTLWVSPTVAGGLTTVEPDSPNLSISAAYVINSAVNGQIFVRNNTGEFLKNNSDVNIVTPTNGDFIVYNTATEKWDNVQPTTDHIAEGTNLYYTDARVDARIPIVVDKAFVDALNVDADTLDGQDGTFYLDYNNFVNTPAGGGSLDNVVEDLSPQLGNNLDVQNFAITTSHVDNNINFTVPAGGTINITGSSPQASSLTTNSRIAFKDGDASDSVIIGAPSNLTATYTLTLPPNVPTTNGQLLSGTTLGTTSWVDAYDTADFNTDLATKTTTDLTEGTNLYYTDGRADARITAATGVTVQAQSAVLDATTASYTTAEETKLAGIESGATADQTPAEILSALLTVDGATSTLDADLLDGQEGTHYLDYNNFTNTPATIANVVEDLSAQLGSNLDVQTFDITTSNVSNLVNIDGTISVKNTGLGFGVVTGAATTGLALLANNADLSTSPYIIINNAESLNLVSNGLGVNIDGQDFPTADGTASQVLTTDGAGTLSWTTPASSGINNVVEDLSPQLGSALDTQTFDITTSDVSNTVSFDALISVKNTGVGFAGITGAASTGLALLANNLDTGTSPNIIINSLGDMNLNDNGNNINIGNDSGGTINLQGNLAGQGNTVSNVNLENYKETNFALAYAATITPDVANGNVQTITLTGNVTFSSFANPAAGQSMTVIIKQDATGSRTLTSTMLFAGGEKTLSTDANAVDIMSVFYDGTTYYASLAKGFA